MKKFARNSLTLATLAVMASGFAGVAQAGSLAYSNLNVLGLKFVDSNGENVIGSLVKDVRDDFRTSVRGSHGQSWTF